MQYKSKQVNQLNNRTIISFLIVYKIYILNLMDLKFLHDLAADHSKLYSSSQQRLLEWSNQLFQILFPLNPKQSSAERLQGLFQQNKNKFTALYLSIENQDQAKADEAQGSFYQTLPAVYDLLKKDLVAKFNQSWGEYSLSVKNIYPQFVSLYIHRISHQLFRIGLKKFANNLTSRSLTEKKICIHEGAKIGEGFVIQAGSNIEIGETAQIGKNVKVYGGVLIGSLNEEKLQKRHPTIEDNVVLFSGAVVLGGRTIIGHDSLIGNGVCITESILPNSKVFNKPEYQVSSLDISNEFSVQSLIGNTPLVEIKNIFKHPHIKIFAKLEGQNPGGSVKDRPAYNMIKKALKRGQIKPGMKLIEPTSGNTGIALAMIACVFNLDIELVMPENSTAERVQTMEAYGAKVVLTPAKSGIEGSRDYAEAQVAKGGYKMLNQFANSDNYMAHYESTGPQIWRDTKGKITHFVSSMGTTGTIMGTSMYLKQKNKDIQIVGVQPTPGSSIPGIRRWAPEYLPKIFNKQRVDHTIDVSEEESLIMMRRLAKEQAIFAGVSSGGSMAAAVRLAKTLESGVIVSIVCDRGDRYLSSGIFAKTENN